MHMKLILFISSLLLIIGCNNSNYERPKEIIEEEGVPIKLGVKFIKSEDNGLGKLTKLGDIKGISLEISDMPNKGMNLSRASIITGRNLNDISLHSYKTPGTYTDNLNLNNENKFINGERIYSNASTWVTTAKWPRKDNVHFFAYGPYVLNTGISIREDNGPVIDYSPAGNVSATQDVVVADPIFNKKLGEDTPDVINFTFKHVLSFFDIHIHNMPVSEGGTVSITELAFTNFKNTGSISIRSGRDAVVINGERRNYSVTPKYNTFFSNEVRLEGITGVTNSLFAILPQKFEGDEAIRIVMSSKAYTYYVRDFTDKPVLPGKKYTFKIDYREHMTR